MRGRLSAGRRWVAASLRIGAAVWLASALVGLSPSTAPAACMGLSTPQEIADAIHAPYGGLAFEGVVRQRWFATYLVEVQQTWQGRPPTRYVAVGGCGWPERAGDECGIRELSVGRSYLFWVGRYPGPMYEMGCGGPFAADPSVIRLLGAGETGPAFGPLDVLALAGFVWWSAGVIVALLAAIIAVVALFKLSRRWSTD